MDLTQLIRKNEQRKGLLATEKISLFYNALTTIFIFILFDKMHNPSTLIFDRCCIAFFTFALWGAHSLYPCRLSIFVRISYQMALLSYWYPDTYEFNRLFPNFDHLFASAEQTFFGCQPSLLFFKTLTGTFWSEAMNFGYVCYFPLIALVTFFYFFKRYVDYEKATFIIMCSFFIYYIIFIFIPVAGPQFYFNAIGIGNASHGHFPYIGRYFNLHTDMLPSPGNPDGIFYNLVESSHQAGERPTAAFPSSHVGISTILMILAHKANRKLFWLMMPCYVLLCCSTVYIQAHYVIDAIAGLISAFIIYSISATIWDWYFARYSR